MILTTELTKACSTAISTRVSTNSGHMICAFFNKVSCVTKIISLSLSFNGWSGTGTSGWVLEQVQNLFQYPATLNLTHLESSELDNLGL